MKITILLAGILICGGLLAPRGGVDEAASRPEQLLTEGEIARQAESNIVLFKWPFGPDIQTPEGPMLQNQKSQTMWYTMSQILDQAESPESRQKILSHMTISHGLRLINELTVKFCTFQEQACQFSDPTSLNLYQFRTTYNQVTLLKELNQLYESFLTAEYFLTTHNSGNTRFEELEEIYDMVLKEFRYVKTAVDGVIISRTSGCVDMMYTCTTEKELEMILKMQPGDFWRVLRDEATQMQRELRASQEKGLDEAHQCLNQMKRFVVLEHGDKLFRENKEKVSSDKDFDDTVLTKIENLRNKEMVLQAQVFPNT